MSVTGSDDMRRLQRYADLDGAGSAGWRALYEQSFPIGLRAPVEDLVAGRPDEQLWAFVDGAPSSSGEVLGIAVVRDLGTTGWSFLRYYAVTPTRRGQGLGSAMWRSLTGELRQAGQIGLALDIEDPDEPGLPMHEADERTARARFYARLGAQLAPVEGYAPPEHGQVGEEPAPPLRLVLAPLGAAAQQPRGHELAGVVTAVLHHRYGLAPDDPALLSCLRRSGL